MASRSHFDELYDEHAAFTWRSLRHLGVDLAAIDDAVQELWVVVHRRLDGFEGRSEVRSWLFGIATNVARNHRRSERRKPASTPLSSIADLADAQAREERADAFLLVQTFLSRLDDQRREVFASMLLEGMSAPETAAATGLDVERVQNLVRAAKRTFKAWLMHQEHRSEGSPAAPRRRPVRVTSEPTPASRLQMAAHPSYTGPFGAERGHSRA